MKHCILMTVYKDIAIVNETISYIPNDWGCYVHIDKKSLMREEDVNTKARVYKLFNIYWGGVEHLKAFLFLLEKAYTSGNDYDYFHLITGQDYFIVRPQDFDKVLGDEGYSYLQWFKCPYSGWWGDGFDILKYRTLSSFVDIREKKWRNLNYLLHIFQNIFHIARGLPPYPIYGGSVYMSLYKECVNEILSSPIAKDLLKRLEFSTNAEEIFFQTVLINSLRKNYIRNTNMRYIDWNTDPAPKILVNEDYESIIRSDALFCRKVDSTVSSQLLCKLRTLHKYN